MNGIFTVFLLVATWTPDGVAFKSLYPARISSKLSECAFCPRKSISKISSSSSFVVDKRFPLPVKVIFYDILIMEL